jgi:hypothetical protein
MSWSVTTVTGRGGGQVRLRNARTGDDDVLGTVDRLTLGRRLGDGLSLDRTARRLGAGSVAVSWA